MAIKKLTEPGLYTATSINASVIVKITGVFPFLNVVNCFDLQKFEKTGRIYGNDEVLRDIKINPQQYFFTPIGESSVLWLGHRDTIVSNVPDYMEYEAEFINNYRQLGEGSCIYLITQKLKVDMQIAIAICNDIKKSLGFR